MRARFDGQTVVILGGNSGIGRASALGFSAEGARLAITGRDLATLQTVAAETGALAIRSDIASIAESGLRRPFLGVVRGELYHGCRPVRRRRVRGALTMTGRMTKA
jgi:short-subunit dehydrogenase involved in D-alanine esterification of teichoic acids